MQSFHAGDWMMTLLGLLGNYHQVTQSGGTPEQARAATIAAGLAVAAHVMAPAASQPTP